MKRELYPENWEEISMAIRTRAGNKCERCGVVNGASILRSTDDPAKYLIVNDLGEHRTPDGHLYRLSEIPEEFDLNEQLTRIILTVAHLNQNPGDNQPENLACLCQRCHLNHDRPWNVIKCRATWQRKRIIRIERSGQLSLFSTSI